MILAYTLFVLTLLYFLKDWEEQEVKTLVSASPFFLKLFCKPFPSSQKILPALELAVDNPQKVSPLVALSQIKGSSEILYRGPPLMRLAQK